MCFHSLRSLKHRLLRLFSRVRQHLGRWSRGRWAGRVCFFTAFPLRVQCLSSTNHCRRVCIFTAFPLHAHCLSFTLPVIGLRSLAAHSIFSSLDFRWYHGVGGELDHPNKVPWPSPWPYNLGHITLATLPWPRYLGHYLASTAKTVLARNTRSSPHGRVHAHTCTLLANQTWGHLPTPPHYHHHLRSRRRRRTAAHRAAEQPAAPPFATTTHRDCC